MDLLWRTRGQKGKILTGCENDNNGEVAFKLGLIHQFPQGKEFPGKPPTGQSYHNTPNMFNLITVSHTHPVSL